MAMMASRRARARPVGIDEALAAIAEGATVYVASGCGVPKALIASMDEQRERWRRLRIVTGYLFESLPVFDHAGSPFSFTSLHPTAAMGTITDTSYLDVVPMRYSDQARLLGPNGRHRPDVALVQVSPPDRSGRCSLGVSVGSVIDAVRSARVVIAQVNELVPYTFGDGELTTDDVDFLVEATGPLVQVADPRPSARTAALAAQVASEVPHGATLQVGIGRMPTAALGALAGHSELGLHSGLFTAGCRDLVEAGVLTNTRKRVDTGVSVAAEIAGDASLFQWVDRNPRLRLVGAATSHGIGSLGQVGGFVALNSALEIDLTGAANAEFADDGSRLSGPGGLPDFVTAALSTPDGRSTIALPSSSSDGTRPRIVEALAGGRASLPAYLADRVATERGVAHLRGRTLAERRDALRAIVG
jgi:acyl-CoA hydrolase